MKTTSQNLTLPTAEEAAIMSEARQDDLVKASQRIIARLVRDVAKSNGGRRTAFHCPINILEPLAAALVCLGYQVGDDKGNVFKSAAEWAEQKRRTLETSQNPTNALFLMHIRW